jgi:hypothetical protein
MTGHWFNSDPFSQLIACCDDGSAGVRPPAPRSTWLGSPSPPYVAVGSGHRERVGKAVALTRQRGALFDDATLIATRGLRQWIQHE